MAKWNKKTSQDKELLEIETSYQQYIKGKYKDNKQSKKLAIWAFILSGLAIVTIIFSVLFYYNNWLFNTKIHNVTIGGISLQGLTTEEATKLLDENRELLLPNNDIIIKIVDRTLVLTNKDTKAKLNTSAIANAAYLHGRNNADGDTLLTLDPQDFVSLDASSIRALLKDFVQPYNGIPVETSITITGDRPDLSKPAIKGEPSQILTIKLGTPTYLCDPEGIFRSILDAHKNRTYELVGEVILKEPVQVTARSIFAQYCVSPINATLDPETFVITEGIDGYGFNVDAVQAMLDAAQWGEELAAIPLSRIKPQITSDTINAELFKDVLASYTTHASSQVGRNDNLKLACKAINGIILYPGDTFSYNKTLGERTKEKGYKEANTFYGGEIVPSVGGGICQVSSTLYWCAMHADLEITQRVNHGRLVTYMPSAMDATVSWGYVDFCFKNNSNYPIRIEASANKGNVSIKLLGTDDKDYYVKVISKTKKVTEYTEVQKEFPVDNEFGYVNGQVVSNGRTGYVIETYRCKYSKETNKEISRAFEATSTYPKADTIIALVPTPEPSEPETSNPDNATESTDVTDTISLT